MTAASSPQPTPVADTITDDLRMVAYRAAREWAAEHRHPQPDDRMVDAVLAALTESGRLLPPGGEVSTQYTVLGSKDGHLMPVVGAQASLEAAQKWKARLEGDRSVSRFTLAIYQRSAHLWDDGPIREAYGPWVPVVSTDPKEATDVR